MRPDESEVRYENMSPPRIGSKIRQRLFAVLCEPWRVTINGCWISRSSITSAITDTCCRSLATAARLSVFTTYAAAVASHLHSCTGPYWPRPMTATGRSVCALTV